jgi:hypothetical protein
MKRDKWPWNISDDEVEDLFYAIPAHERAAAARKLEAQGLMRRINDGPDDDPQTWEVVPAKTIQ